MGAKNLIPGASYHLLHKPICSKQCVATCAPCQIDTKGTYTGREWETLSDTLYEFTYIGNNTSKCGVFSKKEILDLVQTDYK